MSIDSTTDLLFHIGADSDEAEDNIQRFRTLLGKDLEDIGAEFAHWREEVLGDISTVSAAMTAGAAVMGAAVVAIAAASAEAADKFAEYVSEVDRGSKTTGLAAEDMSALKFAAHETGTSYEGLVTGLTRFASTIAMANEGGATQQQMFARLGISQAQVAAGEKDMMPLLMAVADSFAHMGSVTQRTAAARDLFSRGGAELVRMLGLGSEGLRDFAKEAEEMGMIISGKDVTAVRELQAATNMLKAEQEALDNQWGRVSLPTIADLKISWLSLIETVKTGHFKSIVDFVSAMGANFAKVNAEIEKTALIMDKLGDGKGIDAADAAAKEATQDFRGLSGAMESVREKMHSGDGEIGKATEEIQHLRGEVSNLAEEYYKAVAAGKLTAESSTREAMALSALPKAIADLWSHMSSEATAKIASEVTQFGADLQKQTNSQAQQTLQIRYASWALEVSGLRAHLAGMKDLEVGQRAALLAQLDALEKAGQDKINRDWADSLTKSEEDIDHQIADQTEKSYTQQVMAWNREVDALAKSLAEKEELTDENQAKLDALRKAGIDKINREQSQAYAREIAELQNHLSGMLSAYMTHEEKLTAQYQKDLAAFGAAKEAEMVLEAHGDAQIAATHAQFAAIRTEIMRRYELDLQQLQNSQGWQGVFGSKFDATIQHNEALMKQWQTSSNQSILMVQVALKSLQEDAQKAFQSFADGMGSAIAHAIVYKQSIGAAMEAAAKSTLESLASQALGQAIYSLALGFLDLAEGNGAGAAAAFEAAALFGAVGAAAAVAGSALPGGQSASGASGTGSAGSGSGKDSGSATGQTATPAAGPQVHVYVAGHIFGINGIEALTGAINDAVLNRDVTLTATNTKTGQVVTR